MYALSHFMWCYSCNSVPCRNKKGYLAIRLKQQQQQQQHMLSIAIALHVGSKTIHKRVIFFIYFPLGLQAIAYNRGRENPGYIPVVAFIHRYREKKRYPNLGNQYVFVIFTYACTIFFIFIQLLPIHIMLQQKRCGFICRKLGAR